MIMVGVVFEKKPFRQLKQLTSKLYTKCYTTVNNTVVRTTKPIRDFGIQHAVKSFELEISVRINNRWFKV